MENNPQAQVPVPANSPSAQVPDPANGVLSPEIQNYVAEPTPNTPANPVGAPAQGQPEPTQAVAPNPVAELQRKLNEKQIEVYQAQQAAQAAQQLLMQNQMAGNQIKGDPEPDPQTNWSGWIQWNNRQTEARILGGVAKQQQEWLNGLMASANEVQFVNTHPDVNIQQLKSFAQMRGIQNMEDAYIVMTMPQALNGAAMNASQQTIQQFRQPTGATPLRTQGQTAPQGQVQVSYQKMAEAYAANPNVEQSWPPELKEMFWSQTYARKNSA
jgi:hypothetical protein